MSILVVSSMLCYIKLPARTKKGYRKLSTYIEAKYTLGVIMPGKSFEFMKNVLKSPFYHVNTSIVIVIQYIMVAVVFRFSWDKK